MRQAIRALGWAANIFSIILLFFTVTAVYSAFRIRPEFGDHSVSTQGGTLTFTLPFLLNNGGFYDISNLNITTLVKDSDGSLMSSSSTFVPLISRGSNVSVTHNISISLSQMTTENLRRLLFNDSVFDVAASLKLNYAKAIPFEISINSTMPWGAPLHNLSIGDISVSPYNATHFRAIVPISFENHSFFSLNGTMRLELVDNINRLLGYGTANIDVPSQSGYSFSLEVFVSDPTNIKEARLYFITSIFSYGPVVIPFV